ncbi:MAG TPA: phage tail protein, partial [Solirubrobacteraceae bacterium]|nr:phage tail protein [Solirubrobacteraceae bacterium]
GDFTMRFLGSLEEQLDPIVATLDSLAGFVSPETAPVHVLRLEAYWLGLLLDEDLPASVCRELVRHASELNRRRGTAAGLQLLLRLTFPDIPLQVEDRGRVTFGDRPPPTPPARQEFVVRAGRALDPDRRAAIAQVIERERPAHVAFELIEPARSWAATR